MDERISPLRTDAYQFSMIAGYFLRNIHNQKAVFNVFYRKSPLGEYAIFVGLRKILNFLETFKFTKREIEHLKTKKYSTDPKFYEYLETMDMKDVTVFSVLEGSIVFPKVPIMKLVGPLAKVQLIETIILSLINYPTLTATYASRIRHIIGPHKKLLEFGLRRCPGIGSGTDASEASFIGGADGTSNVEAEELLDIPAIGTIAHSFIQNHEGINPLKEDFTLYVNDRVINLWNEVLETRKSLGRKYFTTSEHELVAFTSAAQQQPHNFVALLDTIDTLNSGVLNFIVVAKTLLKFGFIPVGVRLDSGDLAYLSKEIRYLFDHTFDEIIDGEVYSPTIIASNDLNIAVVKSLKTQKAQIDVFAIGTNLVNAMTYKGALGAVYKASMRIDEPLMKHSESDEKISFPGNYTPYRLYNSSGNPFIDILVLDDEEPPIEGNKIYCLHPFDNKKKCYFTPSKVECLYHKVFDDNKKLINVNPKDSKIRASESLSIIREDHLRDEFPTPYKLSLTEKLYKLLHEKIEEHSPILELS